MSALFMSTMIGCLVGITQDSANCLWLLRHAAAVAFVGPRQRQQEYAARIAMKAITTSN